MLPKRTSYEWQVRSRRVEVPFTSAKEENQQSNVESAQAPDSTDPLFAVSKWATPKLPRVCGLPIHLGKDTQHRHSLSAHCYKPGDLSATTRPAVSWTLFMEPAGDYRLPPTHAPRCLCGILMYLMYLDDCVSPILWIRLNNGLQSAWIMHVSLPHDGWSWAECIKHAYAQTQNQTRRRLALN